MLQLITKPIQIGFSVAGAAIGFVRSQLGGDDRQPRFDSERVASAGRVAEAARSADRAPTPTATAAAEKSDDTGEEGLLPGAGAPDDLLILDRVKSEIFRPGDAEKGSVNVNVENGVVFLRGDVDDPEQSEYFEVAAAEVEGVVRVENLIGSSD